ncbi:hypothetical protein HDV02_004323 [Globomyces sp. JEL0801]|nr:hypothetical protein HDV02_004323 [Globomyces sp. JEL0801]
MEYASGTRITLTKGGELFEHILARQYLKEREAGRFFAQLIVGMTIGSHLLGVGFLHNNGIVHRDLKLENLLLDKNRNVIITDFGFANRFSKETNDMLSTSCGSPCYAAPELVVNDTYVGESADIWSLGVILYAMLCGYLPFDDDPTNAESDNINQLYKYILETQLEFPAHVSPVAKSLINRILVTDPEKRADMKEIKSHLWLKPFWHIIAEDEETGTVSESKMLKAKKEQVTTLPASPPPESSIPAPHSAPMDADVSHMEPPSVSVSSIDLSQTNTTNDTPQTHTTTSAIDIPTTTPSSPPQSDDDTKPTPFDNKKPTRNSDSSDNSTSFIVPTKTEVKVVKTSSGGEQKNDSSKAATRSHSVDHQRTYSGTHLLLTLVPTEPMPDSDFIGRASAQISRSAPSVHSSDISSLKFHSGPIDKRAMSSLPPAVVLNKIITLLTEMGLEVLHTNNPYKLKVYKRPPGEGHYVDDMASDFSDLDTTFAESQSSPRHSPPVFRPTVGTDTTRKSRFGSVFTSFPTNVFQKIKVLGQFGLQYNRGFDGNETPPVPTSKPVEPETLKFNIMVNRIKNLDGLLSVDLKRLRGDIWEFKRLYHEIILKLGLGVEVK